MLIASIPLKMPTAFAQSAVAPYIRTVPIPSQIGIQPGAASFTDGFPPSNFTPISAGGVPPFGDDVNGLLNAVTAWLRWTQAGAPVAYDGTFQTAISGYPLGALVASAVTFGLYFVSTVDGNTTNPDTGGAGWLPVPIASGGVATTGSWTWRPTQEVLPGWTKANLTTIGDASSGATQLADPTAASQFAWLWTNFSNSQCPVLPSGRGANPTADFAAHKTIATLDMRGMAPIGMDTMGGAPTTRLNGVPVISGPATQAGSVLGEVLHALITAELAAHNHGITEPNGGQGHGHGITEPNGGSGHRHAAPSVDGLITGGGVTPSTTPTYVDPSGLTGFSTTGIAINLAPTGITINNTGSGAAHNNVALAMCGTHYFKL